MRREVMRMSRTNRRGNGRSYTFDCFMRPCGEFNGGKHYARQGNVFTMMADPGNPARSASTLPSASEDSPKDKRCGPRPFAAGQTVSFTMAGNHPDNWSTVNDYRIMNVSPGTTWSSTCEIDCQPVTHTVFLWGDDHWGSAAIRATAVLADGQRSIALPGNATLSGPNLAVRLNTTFSASFTGPKTTWIANSQDGFVVYAYAQGTVTITSAGSISVTPASVSLAFGNSQPFSATVTGLPNTSVTWSINPLIGSISSAGVYAAPLPISNQRNVTVTVTSQVNATVVGQAAVTLFLATDVHVRARICR